MSEHFDAVVIGMGPGGEVVTGRLREAGKRVAAVERELIGGECAYWACIPSKTLLRSGEVLDQARRTPGVRSGGAAWYEAADWRDAMTRGLDDHRQREAYEDQGVTVVRGEARVTGPGEVTVGDRVLHCDHIVVATGSEPVIPPIRGLEDTEVWTNRRATGTSQMPDRVAILGGGPVGCEIAQFMRRFGSEVTIIELAEGLIVREEPRVSELVEEHFAAEGIQAHTKTQVKCVENGGAERVVSLDDGITVTCDAIVAATGRRPRTTGLGLESVGLDLSEGHRIEVDGFCRAAEGVWAVGDVTGVMPFTHVAKYQGRVVADAILGHPHPARYDGVPRVVFTDPEVAAVGLTGHQARERGIRTAATELDLTAALARPWTLEKEPSGTLGLLADADRKVLVGAWAVAPMASEWMHLAAQAVRAGIHLDVLRDQVAQFPTFAEGFHLAVSALDTD
ncbi:dihydrolipoyl dehydrogenase family protein [Glycomyces xiaoerkulensis]|uniref:dihydrolipoyl dehydrogenase family protein n=1 Tax=Glycomyces xiaoerkulensis TaxID=2038139 RepID=UPI000C264300|nr:NAD(P)/FAD-dependent oxidoreductase [Glycomyces xiaoerkulensis]